MRKKFTIIDYLIIILIIGAVVFAFIHISSDDTSTSESTSYDSSTLNKIVEKYLTYYRQGFEVNTTVQGYNSTDGKPVTLTGNIKWMDDDKGTNVKALVTSNGADYIVGLYNHIPNADIYLSSMTLDMNGDKYSNLTEITIKPKEVTSINDLISGIPNNTDYEISTIIAVDSIDTLKFQETNNIFFQNHERISIKGSNNGLTNQINIVRGSNNDLTEANSIFGEFNGLTNEITIRIYNCSDNDINTIKNNYDVLNIQRF